HWHTGTNRGSVRLKQCVLLLWSAGFLSVGLQAQTTDLSSTEPIRLEQGKTHEGTVAGGQAHDYRFALAAGQYAKLLLDQRSINVAVECFGPDGKLRFSADSYLIGDTETVELVADDSGIYRLHVRAPDQHAPAGRYDITLSEIEGATERHAS